MGFEKGHPKVGGRRAGVPNKQTAQFRAIARELISHPTYLTSLVQRLIEGKATQLEKLLWERALGQASSDDAAGDVDAAAAVVDILARVQDRQRQADHAGGGVRQAAAETAAGGNDGPRHP
jgi:hypothetical protein